MSTRSILIATGLLVVAGIGGCKTQYRDVYSFKKNSFVAPVTKREITAPPTVDALQAAQQPGAAPGIPGAPAIPGAPEAPAAPAPATGIPGLDPAPAPAPTPAPPPGT